MNKNDISGNRTPEQLDIRFNLGKAKEESKDYKTQIRSLRESLDSLLTSLDNILSTLDNKVDKDGNKVLTDNNFTNIYKDYIDSLRQLTIITTDDLNNWKNTVKTEIETDVDNELPQIIQDEFGPTVEGIVIDKIDALGDLRYRGFCKSQAAIDNAIIPGYYGISTIIAGISNTICYGNMLVLESKGQAWVASDYSSWIIQVFFDAAKRIFVRFGNNTAFDNTWIQIL